MPDHTNRDRHDRPLVLRQLAQWARIGDNSLAASTAFMEALFQAALDEDLSSVCDLTWCLLLVSGDEDLAIPVDVLDLNRLLNIADTVSEPPRDETAGIRRRVRDSLTARSLSDNSPDSWGCRSDSDMRTTARDPRFRVSNSNRPSHGRKGDSVTQRLSTPERYKVVLLSVRGAPHGYAVVTWLGEKKAIAIAVSTHNSHPDADAVFDVEVENLGAVHSGSDGSVKLERTDLTDRNEW